MQNLPKEQVDQAQTLSPSSQQDGSDDEAFGPTIEIPPLGDIRNLNIFDAACCGNLVRVQALYQENNSLLTATDEQGKSIFLLAAEHGHLDVAQWSLRARAANRNDKDNEGMTALLLAAKHGHLNVVEWLLKEKKAWSGEKASSKDALLWAAQKHHKGVVKFLASEYGLLADKDINAIARLLVGPFFDTTLMAEELADLHEDYLQTLQATSSRQLATDEIKEFRSQPTTSVKQAPKTPHWSALALKFSSLFKSKKTNIADTNEHKQISSSTFSTPSKSRPTLSQLEDNAKSPVPKPMEDALIEPTVKWSQLGK